MNIKEGFKRLSILIGICVAIINFFWLGTLGNSIETTIIGAIIFGIVGYFIVLLIGYVIEGFSKQ